MTERHRKNLLDPELHHDSCGFGLIANLDDLPSHWVVATAIDALARLTHRGAVAADGKTGDGCGLLIKFPESFLRVVGEEAGLRLAGRFAAGVAAGGRTGLASVVTAALFFLAMFFALAGVELVLSLLAPAGLLAVSVVVVGAFLAASTCARTWLVKLLDMTNEG